MVRVPRAARTALAAPRERATHENGRVRPPVPGEIPGEDETVRLVEGARGLVAVRDLVGSVARRHGKDEEESHPFSPGASLCAVEERAAKPSSSAIGSDRHPRDLQ